MPQTFKPLTYDDIDEGDVISYTLQNKVIHGTVRCKMDRYWSSTLQMNKIIIEIKNGDVCYLLSSAEDLNMFAGQIVSKGQKTPTPAKQCTCPIMTIMQTGCICGSIPRNTTGLAAQFTTQ